MLRWIVVDDDYNRRLYPEYIGIIYTELDYCPVGPHLERLT